MTDEELFQAAQNNKGEGGEHEKEETKRSAVYAVMVCTAVCVVLHVIKFFAKKPDFTEFTIMCSILATLNYYQGKKIGNKKWIVIGVIATLFAIFFFILFIGAMLA